MKHFIYIIVAVAFVAMFSTDVASGTALLKTESKKNELQTKGFGKRAKYGLGGMAVGLVAGKMMGGSRNRGYSSRSYGSSYGTRSYGSTRSYGTRSYGTYGSKRYGQQPRQQPRQQTAAAQAYALLDRKIKAISEQKCGETEEQCRMMLNHFKDQSTGKKDEFTRMQKCLQLKDKNGDFCCMASDSSKYYYKDICVPINDELLDNPVFDKLNNNDQDILTKQLQKPKEEKKKRGFFRI